jgi:diketogulonate reductase-like aldo/keto reductase
MKDSGVAREDIFLETKLWPSFYENEDAVEKTLERLGTDYIDLLLLHQPSGNYVAGYRLMEKAYKEGKVRAIGLSNFEPEQVQEILDICEVKPTLLQTEVNPYAQRNELKAFLKKQGMVIQAWYPLGHGDKNLLNESIITELANKYGKSNAQIILRWHTQNDVIVIPGSRNPEHIKSNFQLFDFELNADEMAAMASINKDARYYTSTPELLAQYAQIVPPVDEEPDTL